MQEKAYFKFKFTEPIRKAYSNTDISIKPCNPITKKLANNNKYLYIMISIYGEFSTQPENTKQTWPIQTSIRGIGKTNRNSKNDFKNMWEYLKMKISRHFENHLIKSKHTLTKIEKPKVLEVNVTMKI